MQKAILPVLICFATRVLAQTDISGGNVSGTWTEGGSPYLIWGNITVPADSTLLIEPAVEVIFQGYYNLTVNGFLEAIGTETDSIYFIPADTVSGWDGIRFLNAPDSSELAYCTVRHVGNSNTGPGGITCFNSDPVITHCLISDNQARGEYPGLAGGIVLSNSDAEISWCDIRNNRSGFCGGGLNLYDSSPIISGCNIAFNSSVQDGGGIYVAGASGPIITGCSIENDTSNGYGGGLMVESGVVTVWDCSIVYNQAGDGGGGIAVSSGNAIFSHCTFAHNQALTSSGKGGGVYASGGALTVNHCTMCSDYVMDPGGENGMEIHTSGSAAATISNSILYSDNYLIVFGSSFPASVSYSDFSTITVDWYFSGNIPPGLGELDQVNPNGDSCDTYFNILLDPLFIDQPNDDFHLVGESPCINAGDPDSPYDPDSTITDMGRYYFDQTVGVDDSRKPLPEKLIISQNYPNPFNSSTVITFSLSEARPVTVTVYDLLGREIRTVLDDYRQAGIYHVTFDASSLPSGIYFYRLQAGESIETRRMVLLK